jgi:hypothetical protein
MQDQENGHTCPMSKQIGTSMSDNGTGACSNSGPSEILVVIFANSGYVLMYLSGCQKKMLDA